MPNICLSFASPAPHLTCLLGTFSWDVLSSSPGAPHGRPLMLSDIWTESRALGGLPSSKLLAEEASSRVLRMAKLQPDSADQERSLCEVAAWLGWGDMATRSPDCKDSTNCLLVQSYLLRAQSLCWDCDEAATAPGDGRGVWSRGICLRSERLPTGGYCNERLLSSLGLGWISNWVKKKKRGSGVWVGDGASTWWKTRSAPGLGWNLSSAYF